MIGCLNIEIRLPEQNYAALISCIEGHLQGFERELTKKAESNFDDRNVTKSDAALQSMTSERSDYSHSVSKK